MGQVQVLKPIGTAAGPVAVREASSLPHVATPAIEFTAFTKKYGRHTAVENLSMAVGRGEVFGLLGPNGAGKTTTLRTLLGFLHPTTGEIRVNGADITKSGVATRRQIGYLPGDLSLYGNLTGHQLLAYLGGLRGASIEGGTQHLAQRFDVDLQRPIRRLSKGNHQKIGLLAAFLGEPPILVLDEPTSGLDPLMQQQFHEVVRAAKRAGRTVLLSSHELSEVEQLCDRVAFIRKGRLVAIDTMDAFRAKASRRVQVTYRSPPPPAAFRDLPGVTDVNLDKKTVTFRLTGPVDLVLRYALRGRVVDLKIHDADLEEIFLSYYQGGATVRGS